MTNTSDTKRERLSRKFNQIIIPEYNHQANRVMDELIGVVNAECLALLERLEKSMYDAGLPSFTVHEVIEQAKKEYE